MQYWGVRIKFDNREVVYSFGSKSQAEYYLIIIPYLMISGNREVDGIKSAKLVPIL